MIDLRDLYQDIILDHGRHPRNFRAIEHPTHTAKGHNPLCGDRVTVYLTLDGDTIADVSFEGRGCAISTAAASLMTEVLKGKTLAEAQALFGQFHAKVTGGPFGSEVERITVHLATPSSPWRPCRRSSARPRAHARTRSRT